MSFPRMPTYVRNDPLGPTGHNNVLQRQDHLYDFLDVEHDPATGEHNTPHVARTLGYMQWTGANYKTAGFGNNDAQLVAGNNPAAGTVIITLAANRYASDQGVIEIQPCSDTGGPGGEGHPWVASAQFTDDTHVTVFLKKNTAAIDTQQVFAATDGDFFIGIRSPHIANSVTRPTPAVRRAYAEGLRVDTANWNPMVQAMGANRKALLAAHVSDGLHNAREVAKAWGFIKWDSASSTYSVQSHQGLGAGLQYISTGQVRVFLGSCRPDIVAPVQAFVRPVSGNTAGVAHTGLMIAMVPVSTCVATSVDVFLYQSYVDTSAGTTYRWRRADSDFFIRVHGT